MTQALKDLQNWIYCNLTSYLGDTGTWILQKKSIQGEGAGVQRRKEGPKAVPIEKVS